MHATLVKEVTKAKEEHAKVAGGMLEEVAELSEVDALSDIIKEAQVQHGRVTSDLEVGLEKATLEAERAANVVKKEEQELAEANAKHQRDQVASAAMKLRTSALMDSQLQKMQDHYESHTEQLMTGMMEKLAALEAQLSAADERSAKEKEHAEALEKAKEQLNEELAAAAKASNAKLALMEQELNEEREKEHALMADAAAAQLREAELLAGNKVAHPC